ncbi:MAG: hypothetical protein LW629_07790 [Burkholderiales bacterium]|nr:hypothetical protein [Burkholderiales bacterium]
MNNNLELTRCYETLLGGCSPTADSEVQRIITMVSQELLNTKNIHTLYCVEESHVYFLCLPSIQLGSLQNFKTPLGIALPAHPKHRGDGIYRVNLYGQSHIAIKGPFTLRVLSNTQEVMDDYIAGLNMSVYDVSEQVPLELVSIPGIYKIQAERISKPLQYLLMGAILLCGLTLAAAEIARVTLREKKDEATPLIKQTISIANSLNMENQITKQMNQIDKISAVTIRAGGWIETYKVSPSSGEAFLIMLPEWVSKDYIDALGNGVVTDRTKEGLIEAKKGDYVK